MKACIILILISLTVQICALGFLDQYVLKNSYEFSSKRIESTTEPVSDINITIPANIKKMELSYDGRYVSYFKNDILYVGDTKENDIKEVSLSKNESIIHCTWLENREVLILLKKVKEKGDEKIQLVSYNAKKSTQQIVKDICEYEKDHEFKDITMSVLTGVYYINIKANDGDTVYRIDRNDDMSLVEIGDSELSNIQSMRHVDRLIYQRDNDILITSPNKRLTLSYTGEKSLLGIDENDIVYVGKVANNKITSVLYGKLNEDSLIKWNNVDMSEPVDVSDLYFNNKSEILIINRQDHYIYNVMTKQKTVYNGELVQVKDKFVASINEKGKLNYNYFN